MKLIVRLSVIAHAKGYTVPQDSFHGWIANPLMVRGVQSNDYDCGVWTLAGIWAVLKGFDVTSHTEDSISCVRSCILLGILSIQTDR